VERDKGLGSPRFHTLEYSEPVDREGASIHRAEGTSANPIPGFLAITGSVGRRGKIADSPNRSAREKLPARSATAFVSEFLVPHRARGDHSYVSIPRNSYPPDREPGDRPPPPKRGPPARALVPLRTGRLRPPPGHHQAPHQIPLPDRCSEIVFIALPSPAIIERRPFAYDAVLFNLQPRTRLND